ncbi:MAG: hypothetical protein U1E49_13795 [Hyphomicrobiaceae bacterium]
MTAQGFGEQEQAGLPVGDAQRLVGQVRRIAAIGPAYTVVKLIGSSKALIHVIESGEEVALKVEDILKDPVTDSIP